MTARPGGTIYGRETLARVPTIALQRCCPPVRGAIVNDSFDLGKDL